jgi:methionyl-tRNA formyltransferase
MVISYNYEFIIPENIIEYVQGKIYNLHISYLPWNKGSNPNFWSFYEDTLKGVTIHQIDKGIDTGKILYQKECILKPEEETFQTSYEKLHQTMVELFKEKWEEIKTGTHPLLEQRGEGSYHSDKELIELRVKHPFVWSDNIADFLQRSR